MIRHLFLLLALLGGVVLAFPLRADDPPGAPGEEARVADYVKALKSKNADVRRQVALTLAELGPKAKVAIPALREALLDSDEDVQVAAARALDRIDQDKPQTPKPDKAVAELMEEVKTLKAQLDQARKEAEVRARSAELAKAQAQEAEQLARKREEALKEARALAEDQDVQAARARQFELQARTEAELMKKRMIALEQRLRELEKALSKSREEPEPEPKKANPPAEDINGVVTKIDEANGLLVLSIGSDAGLSKGQTLEVFRLMPQPRYLGRVVVIDVKPKEAVARAAGKLAATFEVGDKVASKILDK